MKIVKYILLSVIMGVCVSWNEPIEKSLTQAGDNRIEIEKILRHYQKDPKSLHYLSAKFLVENMPYFYSLYGSTATKYFQIYGKVGEMPKEIRDEMFHRTQEQLSLSDAKYISDIRTIKADYLICSIDNAIKTWKNSVWSKYYDNSIFLNYVLPYRISNEPFSNWRDSIAIEYPYLKEPIVWSNEGIRLCACDNMSRNCVLSVTPSAIKGKAVVIDKKDSYVTFSINSDIACEKLVRLRYTSPNQSTFASVIVNDKYVSSVSLDATLNENYFKTTHFGSRIRLNKGQNTITIKYSNFPFAIDYIEIGSIFKYNNSMMDDYSNALCTIQNVESGEFLSMDTLSSGLERPVELKQYIEGNGSFLLRFTYLGYPSWKISPKDESDMCIENRWVSLEPGNLMGKYHYLRSNHQKWVVIPVGDGKCKIMNKNTGLFWQAAIDPITGQHTISQEIENGKQSQLWIIKKQEEKINKENFFKIGSAVSEAMRVTDVTPQFEYTINAGMIPPSIADLCKYRYGTCREETSFVIALSRYLGIPTTTDFTPHWGNRTGSHSWSVVVLPDGKSTPFYMGCAPGDTAQYFHSYLKPKVYRSSFCINREIIEDLKEEKGVPELYMNPRFVDVTDEYCRISNITRDIPEQHLAHKIAYICVFDTKDIVPVHYGKNINGKVTFTAMGRNVAYIMAVYENNKMLPIGNPFILQNDGTVKELTCDYKNRISMTLLRKYPFFGIQDFFNLRMANGDFQGSNNPEFSNATTFFRHEGITNGCWYEREVNNEDSFKYLRYIGPKESFCNINELEFYNKDGKKITGKIIGTQGTAGQDKDKVFDGNILTGFNGNSPDGHWVGLELDKPEQVSKVKYIARNDGNGIEIGDLYQLNIYDHGMWRPLLRMKATDNKLIFNNIPSNGLYLLNDLTKGREERIFTYENNTQMWW